MKTGDYILQEETGTFALVISQLKNGAYKVYAYGAKWRQKVAQKSTKGWYPPPITVKRDIVPPKIVEKIENYLLAKYI